MKPNLIIKLFLIVVTLVVYQYFFFNEEKRDTRSEVVSGDVKSIVITEALANEGDAEAQYLLAYIYDQGLGLMEDDEQALYWYKKSAEQGLVKAQYMLASMYDKGMGVEENDEQAVYWYRKIAERGEDAQIQYLLAYMYDEGLGIEESDERAIYWYRKSAEQGLAKAQRELAIMYYRKKEVVEDYVEAHKWFNIAFKNGYDIEEDRSRVIELEEKMTSAQIKLAEKLAREW